MKKSIEQVLALTPMEVSQVYTGVNHICRCGCGGDYYCSSYHKAPRSEVNDAKVSRLLARAKKLIAEGVAYEMSDNHINVPTHDTSKRGKAITIYWDELKVQKEYRIVVETTFTTEFIVKADSTQKAEEKLNAMYEDGSAYAVEMDQCNTNTIYKSITQL